MYLNYTLASVYVIYYEKYWTEKLFKKYIRAMAKSLKYFVFKE